MVEAMLIDLKAMLVERDECNAGTVQKIREALAQGKTQYRTLRDVTDTLKKKAEAAPPAQAKTWHLKLGIASFFLGHLGDAVTHLKQADGALYDAKRQGRDRVVVAGAASSRQVA